ncbi:MAG: hypothetical protein JNK45_31370 [Myxococcales bacterium]|nr:hypothetical protein [Myxococcales bacterium]
MKKLALTLTMAMGLTAGHAETGNEPHIGIIIMNGVIIGNGRALAGDAQVGDTGVQLAGAHVEHGRLVR